MDDDFDRRRELRRQKREEMRLEAERMSYSRNEDDEEEEARERRRRARQGRMRSRDNEEPPSGAKENVDLNNYRTETATTTTSSVNLAAVTEDDQALLERLAKREERRQRRMMEALERQRELDPTVADSSDNSLEERAAGRRGRYRSAEEDQDQNSGLDSWKDRVEGNKEKENWESKEDEGELQEPAAEVGEPEGEEAEVDEEKEEEEEEGGKPRRSYLREQVVEEKTERSFMTEREVVDGNTWSVKKEVDEEVEFQRKRESTPPPKQQNGGFHQDGVAKHKKPERTQSRGNVRSPEAEELDDTASRQEAERKLEELKRRRDETESGEFERMRMKQQEAEAELEELKRKREERRKVLAEEERQRKQELEEKKALEEEEKRRMKEEIERRRAEAAEKRQKVEELPEGETNKLFKCISPRGSPLKIGERAEFLNKSTQKSTVKTTHSPIVSKIDNRLEQYTTALQSHRELKSAKPAAIDLPMVSDGVRNIKSMWEKGNVFSSPGALGATNKDAAAMKVGVASRINDWLNKTPETGKTVGGKPADLKAGDVTNKRSLWENKGSTQPKVNIRGKSKSVTNGMGH